MGAAVGGCFGLLTGVVVSITQRNLLILPVSVIGGSVSFGFFLGCGMIIRCEDKPMCQLHVLPRLPPAPSATSAIDTAMDRAALPIGDAGLSSARHSWPPPQP